MSDANIPSIDPDIRLFGEVDDKMYEDFYKQLKEAEKKAGPAILCLTTEGGDEDDARRMALEIRLFMRKRAGTFIFWARRSFIPPAL